MAWTLGDYCTLNDVRLDMRIKVDNTNDDDLLENLITESSREIDAYCQRHFYAESQVRYFDPEEDVDDRTLLLDEDLTYVTSILLGDGTNLASTEYVLLPPNEDPKTAIRIRRSSSKWWAYVNDSEEAIAITGSWGYTSGSVPPRDVQRACMSLVRYRYHQRYAPFETAGQGDLGAYGVPASMPQEVTNALLPYRVPKFGALGGGRI